VAPVSDKKSGLIFLKKDEIIPIFLMVPGSDYKDIDTAASMQNHPHSNGGNLRYQ
jgi:hypothetical protein